jgi:uncharacterized repeat protein (TIGR01451 family)
MHAGHLLRATVLAAVAAAALGLAAPPASATLRVVNPSDPMDVRTVDANLDIQPDTMGDAFFAQVQACLNELKGYPEKAHLLQDLVASANEHTIERTNGGSSNRTSPPAANESNGMGTGSQTFWNPTNSHFPTYADGTPRDPCAALLHELVHGHDKDNGVMDRTPVATTAGMPPETVALSEVRACQLQNWLHQAKGMASRTRYGGASLPLGVQFDRCPDRICIYAGDGMVSFPVTDMGDLYYEVPVAGRDPSPIPGKVIQIRDGAMTPVALVTLVKNLDGTVSIRLTCQGMDPVVITQIQFKNDGQPLTPMPVDLPMPLGCNPTAPTATSAPIAVPAVPSMVVVKGPDDRTVPAGGMITFTITVTNKGTVALQNVMVVDPLFPACNFMILSLPPGTTETRMCTVTVGASGFVNVAQAVGQTAGGLNAGPVRDHARVMVD